MKRKMLLTLSVTVLFLISCEGEFIPNTEPAILLTTPDGKCEEGTIDLNNENKLNVPFKWDNGDFEFESGRIRITERNAEDAVTEVDIQISEELAIVNLERGKWYNWQIFGKSKSTNNEVPSDTKEFFSELIDDEGAPYPVIFENPINSDSKWVFEWESPNSEVINDLKYKAYFSISPIEKNSQVKLYEQEFKQYEKEFVSSDALKRIEQPKAGLKKGDYFFRVDAIHKLPNTELTTSSYIRVNAPIDY